MTKHKTGTREQWLAARLELLGAEKDLIHRSDEVARQRRDLPWVHIDSTAERKARVAGFSPPADAGRPAALSRSSKV